MHKIYTKRMKIVSIPWSIEAYSHKMKGFRVKLGPGLNEEKLMAQFPALEDFPEVTNPACFVDNTGLVMGYYLPLVFPKRLTVSDHPLD